MHGSETGHKGAPTAHKVQLTTLIRLATGPAGMAQNGIKHDGSHINNDGFALDLDNDGGMMGGGQPTSFDNLFG